jgi:hypothetical protein
MTTIISSYRPSLDLAAQSITSSRTISDQVSVVDDRLFASPTYSPSSLGSVIQHDTKHTPLPLIKSSIRKPVIQIPSSPPLPAIFTGSILDNFKAALREINMDECEAHGENAFFVCDLAEVWRQHMRWQKELGHRVDAFFGSFHLLLPYTALSNEDHYHDSCQM